MKTHCNRFAIIRKDRLMKSVQRFAGTPIINPCNIATHGGLAALIFNDLCAAHSLESKPEQLVWIIRHDIPETVTGDLLWPAKQALGERWDEVEESAVRAHSKELLPYVESIGKNLFDEEEWILFKLCDYMEGWHQCQEEMNMGNTAERVLDAANNYHKAIKKAVKAISCKGSLVESYVYDYIDLFVSPRSF